MRTMLLNEHICDRCMTNDRICDRFPQSDPKCDRFFQLDPKRDCVFIAYRKQPRKTSIGNTYAKTHQMWLSTTEMDTMLSCSCFHIAMKNKWLNNWNLEMWCFQLGVTATKNRCFRKNDRIWDRFGQNCRKCTQFSRTRTCDTVTHDGNNCMMKSFKNFPGKCISLLQFHTHCSPTIIFSCQTSPNKNGKNILSKTLSLLPFDVDVTKRTASWVSVCKIFWNLSLMIAL